MKKVLLWLDDLRNPMENDWLRFSPIGRDVKVVWVKSYDEFISYLNKPIPLPDAICFDHDLGEEKTGYDCAKYLVEMCMNMKLRLPKWNIQSDNQVGKENIAAYLTNFTKHWYSSSDERVGF